MTSKGRDTLQAIHGIDGAKIFMNWTKKGSSTFATPLCKDEGGGGGFRGGCGWQSRRRRKGRGLPGCLFAEEEEHKKGEDKGSGVPLANFVERPVAYWTAPWLAL